MKSQHSHRIDYYKQKANKTLLRLATDNCLCFNFSHFEVNSLMYSVMTLFSYRSGPYINLLPTGWIFLREMKIARQPTWNLWTIAQPKQQEAWFYLLVIPGLQWNSWNNGVNSTLKKIKKPLMDNATKSKRKRKRKSDRNWDQTVRSSTW